jgi:anti-sigma regulatory factor (Ser/Thr protein kinase)
VTNAVGEVAGEPEAFVSLRLSTRPGSVLIEVWDAHRDDEPVVREAPPDDEHGRGLFLVRTLSAKWGAYRGGFGKVVWAIVEAQDAASAGPRDGGSGSGPAA